MRVPIPAAIVMGVLALAMAGCASTSPTQAGGGGQSTSQTPGAGGTTTGPSMGGTASSPAPVSALAAAAAQTCPTSIEVTPQNDPQAKPVPAGISVAFVLRCKILSTNGRPTTLVAERSTSDPSKLVAALQLPSVPRAKVVCPMMVVQIPYFALVQSSGQTLVPILPLDNCGKPQAAVLTALNTMKFTEITARPIK